MKTLLCSLAAILCCHFGFSQNQDKNEEKGMDYRRSSLCLIMIDEEKMPKRDTIKEAFLNTPIPDKYNDHNVKIRMFSTDTMQLTQEDRQAFHQAVIAGILGEQQAKEMFSEEKNGDNAAPKKKGGFGKFMGSLGKAAASDLSSGMIDTTKKTDIAIFSHKFMTQHRIAKQLFEKWFKDENGIDTMTLVQERGLYDASVLDVQKALGSTRGMEFLADAGEELIKNTFVVVTRYHYLSKDQLVAEIDAVAQEVAKQIGGYASLGAKAATMGVKASLGAGYYVRTTSYLFQMNWNDTIANTLYSELWNKPEAWEASDIYKLKYIGQESAWANVKAGIFTKKSEPELIYIATVNAMDAVLAKLEKKYEVFKTKTPMMVSEKDGQQIITAKIGMKEGVEAGDKFEVLEKVIDPETHRPTYKRKGVVKVSKEQIWDNRYMAAEERELSGTTQDFQETRFEGGKAKYYNGMVLRQIK